jgi:hypothetical protein
MDKETLDAIRKLDDADLAKLIEEISGYGWRKAEETLRMIVREKEAVPSQAFDPSGL